MQAEKVSSTAPVIGFDRFVRLEWVSTALRMRTGGARPSELSTLLDAARLGKEGRVKTRTKLNALVLEPRPALTDFMSRGIDLWSQEPNRSATALFAWGAALAAYPYFGKVSEITGRLTALQGDCSMPELHRRMSELHGERSNVKTATRAVIQSQVDWGFIRREPKGNRIERVSLVSVTNPRTAAWLIEAALISHGRTMSMQCLHAAPMLYPFTFDLALGHALTGSAALEVRTEGALRQVVGLKVDA